MPTLLRRLAPLGILLLVTLLVYWPLQAAGFSWDDQALVADNRYTDSLSNLATFFRVDLWSTTRIPAPPSGYYRPLFLTSLAVDRALFGLNAGPHHLHSLLWHVAAILSLFLVLRALLPPPSALLGAAIFALHPVQVETVALLAARNDSMAATFGLLALSLVLPREVSGRRLVGAGALATAAMLSKESALLLPLLLLALDLARNRRVGALSRYAALGLGILLTLAMRLASGVGGAAWPSPDSWGRVTDRLPEITATYAGLLAWPSPLTPARHLDYIQPLGETGAAALVFLGILAWLLWRARARPLVLAGLGWALLAFSPSLLATLDKGLLGERYLYFPMAGLALAVAAALPRGRWLLPCAAIPLALGAVAVRERTPHWQSSLVLWEQAHEDIPSAFTHGGLAFYLDQVGETEEARLHYLSAIEEDPPYLDTCSSLIMVHLKLKKEESAVRFAEWAHRERGCRKTRDFVEFYGLALAGSGRWQQAVAEIQTYALPLGPIGAVILGAERARARDRDALLTLTRGWRGGEPFEERVAKLLRLAGDQDSASWLQEGTPQR